MAGCNQAFGLEATTLLDAPYRVDARPDAPQQCPPIGTQLRRLELNAPDAEAWIPVFSTRKLERAVISRTGNAWWLVFEGDRITCSYYDGGHSRPASQAAAELRTFLVCVVGPSNWHLTIKREIATLDGIVPVLNLFASYVVEP